MTEPDHPAFRILPVQIAIVLALLVASLPVAALIDRATRSLGSVSQETGVGAEQQLAK